MKKLTVLAILAAVMIVTPAFAVQRNLNPTFVFTGASSAPAGTGPGSTNTNDSCDIGVTPAATLLLPYFEVETSGAAGTGPTTLFTITNTSRFPQIAHVTVFTDWSAPVLDFNIFLTGYDVQSLNLYDVIVRGQIGGTSGTSWTTTPGSSTGIGAGAVTNAIASPASNTNNPNIRSIAYGAVGASGSCNGLPGVLPPGSQQYVLTALTSGTPSVTGVSGTFGCSGTAVGGNHGTKAIGYLTVDLMASCNTTLPTDTGFYADLLYDNVLIGDYQQIGPSPTGAPGSGFDAAGNPMVHIRAVPEGGPSLNAGAPAGTGVVVATNLPFTFYNRYENQPGVVINQDRRQPLPSQWAARWIGGTQTVSGVTVTYNSDYKIWREGVTGATQCSVAANSSLPATAIRFDESENAYGATPGCPVSPCVGPSTATTPETSRQAVGTTAGTGVTGTPAASSLFPPLTGTNASVAGWTYLNLANGGAANILTSSRTGFGTPTLGGTTAAPTLTLTGTAATTGTATTGTAPAGTGAAFNRATSQSWVIVSLFGNLGTQRLAVDFDAAWLGNGCTPPPPVGGTIGPQPFGEPTGLLVCNPVSTAVCPANTMVPIPNP